ncbi:hypothetical protein Ahy_A01g001356 [Arachis hypogaea]|uniref:Uncharacterized protein n=1 Tax=Arachis hypogaea TaxID=3818 RepID=A0A445EMY2_ARAHY|nr:hypothetical protein Ahy_A01g001356 [Arachis hypogaea]
MKDSSSSSSINTQTVEIQGTFETNCNSKETVQLLAKSRRNQEENIQISIKKHQKEQTNIIQGLYTYKLCIDFQHTKDLKCATRLLIEKFEKMSEPQKVIVRELDFGGLMHIPPLNGKTLKNLTDDMMSIGVENEQDRLMFKRIFILYIQMAFLLPTTIKKSLLCT